MQPMRQMIQTYLCHTTGNSKFYNTKWYKITAPYNGRFSNLNTSGSTYDTILAVWSGSRGSLSSLGCNDDVVYGDTSSLISSLTVSAGQTVYIEVAAYVSPFFAGYEVKLSGNFESFTDTDGDSLPDSWEINGYDANNDGIIDVNLPAMGANPLHKDIFVEMDYMVKPLTGDLGPTSGMMNDIVSVFNNAPVNNPDGATGIHIHLQKDQEVPYDPDLNPVWTEFNELKTLYFDPNRTVTHHYMIWANSFNGTSSSGVSREINASDFLVTLGGAPQGGTYYQRLGTFIHELGHNLNLRHGGTDHDNYKPNYLSIMNYSFQFSGLYKNGHWGYQGYPLNFDYQSVDVPNLDENNLDESEGLTGLGDLSNYGTLYSCPDLSTGINYNVTRVDWNCDGDSTDFGVQTDINLLDPPNQVAGRTTLTSQNNWQNISFTGGGIIGSANSLSEAQFMASVSTPIMEEVTWEQMLEMEQNLK